MAGRITLWGAGELLNTFFGQTTAAPANFYLALIKDTAPTAYVSGAELDEPDVGGYTRAVVPNDNLYWSNDSQPQVMLTTSDVVFVEATANWGTVKYWALCNAEAEGYVYATGALASVYQIGEGDTAVMGAGDLSFALGPFYTEDS